LRLFHAAGLIIENSDFIFTVKKLSNWILY